MIAPVFWNTILIVNYALLKYDVPRKTEFISTSNFDFSKRCNSDDFVSIASPRMGRDKITFYFSNGIVSWLNCKTDLESGILEWQGEVNMLKDKGLKFGQDMIRVEVMFGDKISTCDDYQRAVNCEWVKALISDSYPYNPSALVWIDVKNIFKGHTTRTIKT